MCSARRGLLLSLAALSLAAATAAPALADGDPASDYLLSQNVFLPFDGKVPTAAAGTLSQLAHDAAAHGYPIRVALITSPYDLGSVTALWAKPQKYAEFLGQELYFVYRGRLLVVMPNGYGVSRAGKPDADMSRAVESLPPPAPGGAGAAEAAQRAVRLLAASGGVTLSADTATSGPHSTTTRDRIAIGLGAVALLALGGAVMLLRRRRRTA
jgi:MYXO-CTERM domain-containing protein